jgi:hypothetical protein
MSGTKVVGSAGGAAAAGTLPITGSPTLTVVAAAAAVTVTGLLLIRSSRLRKTIGA